MYEVVAAAVRGLVGPAAHLSPANFPRGLSMNVVRDINTYLVRCVRCTVCAVCTQTCSVRKTAAAIIGAIWDVVWRVN